MPIKMYESFEHLESDLGIVFDDYINMFRELEKHVKPEMLPYFRKRRNELTPSRGIIRKDVT